MINYIIYITQVQMHSRLKETFGIWSSGEFIENTSFLSVNDKTDCSGISWLQESW